MAKKRATLSREEKERLKLEAKGVFRAKSLSRKERQGKRFNLGF
jgi:hypothetical protein